MDTSTLQRARGGDEQAFRELVQPYLRELQLHCYRMLGSLTDAEDLLQEVLLAAWQGLPRFEQRSSLRTWLYRIATNRCLNAARDRARRMPAEPTPPFQVPEPGRRAEITWLQPYPGTLLEEMVDPAPGAQARYESSETIELAFITALQRMPRRQVAVLLLRDVLGFGARETAGMLDTSSTAIKRALQRARGSLDRQRAGATRLPRAPAAVERETAQRFAEAYVAADLDAVVALLTDDAWLSMPPAPHQYRGRAAVAAFLRAAFAGRGARQVRLLPACLANTHPAFGSYLAEPGSPTAVASGLHVVTVTGGRIQALTHFLTGSLHSRFGLPASVRLDA
jgi:RNA polymerase sigma-70 factor (ECF subfamily)